MSTSFWVDSDDEWDDDIYSSEDSGDEKEEVKPTSKFAGLEFDDEEEDDKRVTRSAEEKAAEELTKSIKVLRNKLFINDWNSVATEWETLKKIVTKSEPVFGKIGIPIFLTSFLLEMEDRVNEMSADKAFKKSTSPTNARSLNSMKQGLKKWFLANPEQAARVVAFRENPKLAEEQEEVKPVKKTAGKVATKETASNSHGWSVVSHSADSGVSSAKPAKLQGRAKWLKRQNADDSSSSSDEDDDSSWLDDDDDDDGEDALVASAAGRKKHDGAKDKKKRPSAKGTKAEDSESESDEDDEPKKTEAEEKKEKEKEKAQEWNAERIDARLKELVARRGTRNYDRIKQVTLFAFLMERTKEKAHTVERVLRISFALIDALFDVNQNMYTHMNVKLWKHVYNTVVRTFDLMAANEGKVEVVETEPLVPAGKEYATDEKGVILVRGLMLSVLERLDEEYLKSMQIMDPHTQDYVARMRHEPALLKLLKLGFDYFERRGETQKAALLAARRLDHLYYRRETEGASQRAALREAQRAMASEMQDAAMARDLRKQEDRLRESSGDSDLASSTASVQPDGTESVSSDATEALSTASALSQIQDEELLALPNVTEEANLVELVPMLCALVYKSDDERLRIRAVLQHIYHLALHDKYFEARDRMLATRMQDEIMNANDPSMHILFNRALVQLGLAAFRKGRIPDAHSALAEIVGPRLKELLAQGLVINRNVERTAEQEKLERRRQMPYPMHINIDLIEYVHLTSAMLLEVPNMAASTYDSRRRPISKTFRKTIDNSERQTFTGPPENTKDHVIAASKALMQADWSLCASLLLSLDIWKLIPKADDVKVMLKRKIQEEALRTHLFSNAHFYETIKLESLVTQFNLPKHTVHAIASKMMQHEELAGASWDQPSESIIFSSHRSHSHLHHLALQYADRINNLFDNSDANDSSQSHGQGQNQSQQSNSRSSNSQNTNSGPSGTSQASHNISSNSGSQSQKRSGNTSGGKKDYKGNNQKQGKGNKRRN